MKIAENIAVTIDRLPKGYVFTYINFITEVKRKEAVIKALNRMARSGKIVKLSKGRFYKPEPTPFGNLRPNQYQIVKDLLEKNAKVTGYLTGYSIYNQLGLITQVSNTIQIGKKEIRPSFKRARYTISFIKQKNTITKENVPLLQLLDAIRYIKKIPDTDTSMASKRFLSIIKDLSEQDKAVLVKLALKYPHATRALVGVFLEEIGNSSLKDKLRKSLNPITVYKLSGISKILPAAEKWNIKG